jgi:hypothetical protein
MWSLPCGSTREVVIPEIADLPDRKVVIDTSTQSLSALTDRYLAHCRKGSPSGQVVSGLLPKGAMYAKAFGTLSAPLLRLQCAPNARSRGALLRD